MTLSTFRRMFPEFRATDSALITDELERCALELDSDVYGTKYDVAHGYLTAHKLATSPAGMSTRLDETEPQTSTYLERFRNILLQVGHRVIVI